MGFCLGSIKVRTLKECLDAIILSESGSLAKDQMTLLNENKLKCIWPFSIRFLSLVMLVKEY